MEKLVVYAADSNKSVNSMINEIIELGVIQLEKEMKGVKQCSCNAQVLYAMTTHVVRCGEPVAVYDY